MENLLPGTTLVCPPGKEQAAFSVLEPVFAVSGGGLGLSQVSELTGLPPSSIQNWVKRGWVARPVAKKYDEIKVARILLINLLRSTMQMEQIANLLAYVNGSVNDRGDDSMPDPRLYSLVSAAMFRLKAEGHIGRETLVSLIEEYRRELPETVPDAPERLLNALEIILLDAEAAMRIKEADEKYRRLMVNEEADR
ncbi:MAG: DUF1836 domain-containing protein [Clostridia bacterium]|nr:DUF1836 domain-containing protein [Clostridia bacterium]